MTRAALLDLFRRHREKATGLWKLGQEPNRTIFFDSGDIVFAQSTYPADRLTHLLVERGKLTQAQLDYALANLRTGISIGKNLIEMGFITQRDLLDVARAQVERVVCGALATADETPAFEGKELDAHVVRLPFDTPELLLTGLLGLKDREGLLELLGPLNQVVVLQGRRLLEMALPADLAKLTPLLDGSHTLLELSRESLAEPIRLGTFALFLREMGWARLHEMPPMDRGALDIALATEPEALSEPLPEPSLETVPTLFTSIHAAAKPTTNLEHLSQALDELPDPEPSSGFAVETGQAILPPPPEDWPVVPEDPAEPEPIPAQPEPEDAPVLIMPSTLTGAEAIEEPPPPELSEELPRRSRLPLFVLLGLALGAGAFLAWKHFRRAPAAPIAPAPPAPQPAPAPEVVPAPAQPEPAKPEAPPEPKPSAIGISVAERVAALRKQDIDLAVRQGEKYLAQQPKDRWTLRLEIACQAETLAKAVDFFPVPEPDLWIVPLSMRDGRGCYQVFHGSFAKQAEAEAAVKKLPAAFRAGGNRPKPFRIAEIATRQ